jgi:hypothetical protein
MDLCCSSPITWMQLLRTSVSSLCRKKPLSRIAGSR